MMRKLLFILIVLAATSMFAACSGNSISGWSASSSGSAADATSQVTMAWAPSFCNSTGSPNPNPITCVLSVDGAVAGSFPCANNAQCPASYAVSNSACTHTFGVTCSTDAINTTSAGPYSLFLPISKLTASLNPKVLPQAPGASTPIDFTWTPSFCGPVPLDCALYMDGAVVQSKQCSNNALCTLTYQAPNNDPCTHIWNAKCSNAEASALSGFGILDLQISQCTPFASANKNRHLTCTVVSDLSAGNSVCLALDGYSGGIDFNCGGKSIAGSPPGTGISIKNSPNSNVRNCALSNLGTGLLFENSQSSSASQNQLANCGIGISAAGSGGMAIDCAGKSITGTQAATGIIVKNSPGSNVRNCALSNLGTGLLFENSQSSSAYMNQLANCGIGINATGSGGMAIDCAGKSINGTPAGTGISIANSNNSKVQGCAISNFGLGISASESEGLEINCAGKSLICPPSGTGISITNSKNSKAQSCAISNCVLGISASGSEGLEINCAGKSINGTSAGTGISIANSKNSKVQSCAISKFMIGLMLSGSESSSASQNQLKDFELGMGASGSGSFTASSNSFLPNLAQGGVGVSLLSSPDSIVSLSSFTGKDENATFIGVLANLSDSATVEDSSFSKGFTAVSIIGSTGAIVQRNGVTGFSTGVEVLQNSRNAIITGNSFHGGTYGVSFSGSPNSQSGVFDNIFNQTDIFLPDAGGVALSTSTTGTNVLGCNAIGGNAWLGGADDGYSQTCANSNYDCFCDSPYAIKTKCPEDQVSCAGIACSCNVQLQDVYDMKPLFMSGTDTFTITQESINNVPLGTQGQYANLEYVSATNNSARQEFRFSVSSQEAALFSCTVFINGAQEGPPVITEPGKQASVIFAKPAGFCYSAVTKCKSLFSEYSSEAQPFCVDTDPPLVSFGQRAASGKKVTNPANGETIDANSFKLDMDVSDSTSLPAYCNMELNGEIFKKVLVTDKPGGGAHCVIEPKNLLNITHAYRVIAFDSAGNSAASEMRNVTLTGIMIAGCEACSEIGNYSKSSIAVRQDPANKRFKIFLYSQALGTSERISVPGAPILVWFQNSTYKNLQKIVMASPLSEDEVPYAIFSYEDYADSPMEYSFIYCCFYEDCGFDLCLNATGVNKKYIKDHNIVDVQSIPNGEPAQPQINMEQRYMLPTMQKFQYSPSKKAGLSYQQQLCLPLSILFAFLAASLFYMGKNPFGFLDVSQSRIGRHIKYTPRGSSVGFKISSLSVVKAVQSLYEYSKDEKSDDSSKADSKNSVATSKQGDTVNMVKTTGHSTKPTFVQRMANLPSKAWKDVKATVTSPVKKFSETFMPSSEEGKAARAAGLSGWALFKTNYIIGLGTNYSEEKVKTPKGIISLKERLAGYGKTGAGDKDKDRLIAIDAELKALQALGQNTKTSEINKLKEEIKTIQMRQKTRQNAISSLEAELNRKGAKPTAVTDDKPIVGQEAWQRGLYGGGAGGGIPIISTLFAAADRIAATYKEANELGPDGKEKLSGTQKAAAWASGLAWSTATLVGAGSIETAYDKMREHWDTLQDPGYRKYLSEFSSGMAEISKKMGSAKGMDDEEKKNMTRSEYMALYKQMGIDEKKFNKMYDSGNLELPSVSDYLSTRTDLAPEDRENLGASINRFNERAFLGASSREVISAYEARAASDKAGGQKPPTFEEFISAPPKNLEGHFKGHSEEEDLKNTKSHTIEEHLGMYYKHLDRPTAIKSIAAGAFGIIGAGFIAGPITEPKYEKPNVTIELEKPDLAKPWNVDEVISKVYENQDRNAVVIDKQTGQKYSYNPASDHRPIHELFDDFDAQNRIMAEQAVIVSPHPVQTLPVAPMAQQFEAPQPSGTVATEHGAISHSELSVTLSGSFGNPRYGEPDNPLNLSSISDPGLRKEVMDTVVLPVPGQPGAKLVNKDHGVFYRESENGDFKRVEFKAEKTYGEVLETSEKAKKTFGNENVYFSVPSHEILNTISRHGSSRMMEKP